ncbi:uncharacterized protein LOC116004057 [Ipomoea triloba]|uniref:uncharacterized protein LOC116004057 n=1 Tax=Ipomoea triloba TaxID=35885 RepID=UPI00125E8334|nr:uncharacterized protein LOC116004057 [Ipomoea triloba]
MAKAYDRMEWPYLRGMLLALGFAPEWVNGEDIGQVIPTRGIRQGDPLSPYLFIICVEGLSLLLQQAEQQGLIHGCRVARGAPPISHLFFADDSLLFFKANVHEAGVIKQCLTDYEALSGQAVNFNKSSVCFSRNTSRDDREGVVSVLGVGQAPNFGKYLGLPAFVGRNKKAVFVYVEDKLNQRVGTWNKKLISQARKEVVKGAFIGKPRTVYASPRSMEAWRFLTNPQSLVPRIYKARYFPRSSFVDATLGGCPSFCWRSIMAAHELVCSGVRRRIGNGKTTLIWGHPWLPDDPDPLIQTVMPQGLDGSFVSGLIDPTTNSWDQEILKDIFQPNDVERILSIPISHDYEDSWYWYGDPRGCYTVKQGYRRICGEVMNEPATFDKWLPMWKIKAPPKWKAFLWRAIKDVLPTTTNLILKRVDVLPTCPMCGQSHENTMHSLVLCDFSKLVWHEASLPISSVGGGDTFADWFSNVMSLLTDEQLLLVVATLYHIWTARNRAVWEHSLPRPTGVWRAASAAVQAWQHVHHPQTSNTAPSLPGCHPPPQTALPSFACFFDAGFLPTIRRATVGATVLSDTGAFVAAFNGLLRSCMSPLMAESLACKEVLSWLKNKGLDRVVLHIDNATLQRWLTADYNEFFSYIAFSIDASRAIMSSFSHCSISWVPRTANLGAHALASLAFSQSEFLYWDSIPPDTISALI